MTKELIILTEHFAPSTGATAQLVSDLADDLYSMGVSLRVITSTPGSCCTPFPVNRISLTAANPASILHKSFNGLLFFFGSILWLLSYCPANQGILIVSNPPFLGLVGVILSLLKRARYIFLFQDVFPRSASLAGILPARGPLISLWRYILRLVLSRSHDNVVLSAAMQSRCRQEFGQDIPLTNIPNWAVVPVQTQPKSQSTLAANWAIDRSFTVQYSGNFGRVHEILTILEAARLLQGYPCKFLFIGSGAKTNQILTYCKTFSLKNVIVKSYQPRTLLSDSLAACDISIVSLVPGAEDTVAPSKYYGILASSRPVLLISNPDSEIALEIIRSQSGVVISPGDVLGFCDAIIELASNPDLILSMGTNARGLYEKCYGRSKSAVNYFRLFSKYDMI